MVALAITGSLARGTPWAGSDVDLWGFTESSDEAFEDGMVDDLYWEIDLRHVSWLDVDADDWLRPPALEADSITALEARTAAILYATIRGRSPASSSLPMPA